MSEPSPNPEQQILEESTSTSTPLANGTPLPADIEMADSAPTPAAESTPDSAGAYAADSAWEPDEGVFESVCHAAFARGDEAFGDDGAG
ncbi:hypothetical protein SNOG_04398 [Parastagonospora nodorum SN15]|uniref:Uncharacterized protein n=1 Tax=Phaeosphaeria nodorum (strain SN15 / ATCC MYA-4574 / FGSC 10173) TaxID=321614 RepID=Q0UV16_PHANO|nr:hypothetical protein SNOG_04398 [Parastagonospora nodorum SN15]EAT88158.2 hypothetical protein SNOG_04398 [Parastagonospora nodorum SN15]